MAYIPPSPPPHSPPGTGITGNGSIIVGDAKQVIKKGVGYVAEGTVTTQLLSISKTADTGADQTQQTPDPQAVSIENTGRIPVVVLLGYESYSTATADGDIHYLQTLLLPQSSITPPLSGIIPTASLGQVFDGTIVDFADTSIMVESASTLAADLNTADTTVSVGDGSIFRVNDLIQVGINATTATRIEIMRVTAIADTAGDGAFTACGLFQLGSPTTLVSLPLFSLR